MVGALGLASALWLGGIAGAQGYTPSIEASAEGDGTVEVCGEGWQPGEEVSVSADSESEEVTADENGEFCTDLEVACTDAEQNNEGESEVEVTAEGDTSGAVETDVDLSCGGTTAAGVTPTAEATQAAAAGKLAFTGSSSAPLAAIGIGFVLVGAVMAVIVYRKRTPHSLGA
jgi:hypothetical protein